MCKEHFMAIAIEQKDHPAIYTQPRWKEKVGGLQELGVWGADFGPCVFAN